MMLLPPHLWSKINTHTHKIIKKKIIPTLVHTTHPSKQKTNTFGCVLQITVEESDNEDEQNDDGNGDGKPSSSQSQSSHTGMWRRVVGLCRKLTEKAQTFWLIRWKHNKWMKKERETKKFTLTHI